MLHRGTHALYKQSDPRRLVGSTGRAVQCERNTCTGNGKSPAAGTVLVKAMAEAVELGSVSAGVRALFYMLTPNESSFQRVEDVPHYVQQVGTASLSLTSRNK